MKTQHNKGKIKDNAIKALVRSNIFRHQEHKKLKGNGSYSRKNKHKNRINPSYDKYDGFIFNTIFISKNNWINAYSFQSINTQ